MPDVATARPALAHTVLPLRKSAFSFGFAIHCPFSETCRRT